ncbi:MAG: DUF4317 domain-containing protein [Clostridiales bacterium]|nr:DUF4317 domain-containing protein [Clostridiales bacterium]
MTKKDILELKRRLKKDDCTFTRLRGCYVDADKNIILQINENFLNLVEEEFFKYLEIAKKTLSGTLGNNLLELSFQKTEQEQGGKRQFLLHLRDSALKDDAVVERLYELIIENYDYTGNYLILLFHDAYDVITKTNDNQKIDESTEVYEYLLCAVCPVELTKAGLGYRKEENRIGARIRDWVVSSPEIGFLFPAFSDRSSDIHSLLYYTRNTKQPHQELMTEGLGCTSKRTAVQEKKTFQEIITSSLSEEDQENKNEILMNIQETLNSYVEEHDTIYKKEPILLTKDVMHNIISDNNISQNTVLQIEKAFDDVFYNDPPIAEHVIDEKALKENTQKKKEQELQKTVSSLKQQLEKSKDGDLEEKSSLPNNLEDQSVKNDETKVILRVSPQKVIEIHSQILEGKKCLIIPLESGDQTIINGIVKEM